MKKHQSPSQKSTEFEIKVKGKQEKISTINYNEYTKPHIVDIYVKIESRPLNNSTIVNYKINISIQKTPNEKKHN